MKKEEIIEKLKEEGINFDENLSKKELLSLLSEKEEIESEIKEQDKLLVLSPFSNGRKNKVNTGKIISKNILNSKDLVLFLKINIVLEISNKEFNFLEKYHEDLRYEALLTFRKNKKKEVE